MAIKFPRLLPREEKFFDLFKDSSKNVLEGAQALKDLVNNYQDVEIKVKRIKDIEHRGDIIFHDITDKLNKTFVTPLDREDIHHVASELDDVLDAIEGISSRLLIFKIDKLTPACVRLVDIIYQGVVQIEKAVSDLEHFNNLHPFCIEINRLENEADVISQSITAQVLDEEPDWRMAIKWKEIYGRLETAADHCQNIADAIETIVVKNA